MRIDFLKNLVKQLSKHGDTLKLKIHYLNKLLQKDGIINFKMEAPGGIGSDL